MFFGGIVEPMTSNNNELPRESSSNFPLPTSLPVISETNAIRKEVIHNYFETAEASDGGEEPTLSDSDSDFDDSDANSPPSVPLYPFQNQVGGHASLLRFSERALCKPLMKHEKAMYEHFETETPDILPFISSYLGVLNVTFTMQDEKVTPVVLFEKNQHILPDDILKRFLSSSVPSEEARTESPGVTKVNKKLQEQIFHEACSPRSGRSRLRNHSSKRAERRRPKQSLRRHSFSESNSELAKPPSKPSLLQVKKSDVRLISSFESDHPPYDTSDEELVNNRPDTIKISAQITPGAPTATSKGVSVEEDSLLFHMEDIEEALPVNSLLPSLTPAPTPPLNPWSMEVYRSTMDKMATTSTSNAIHQFLLINDLTYKMQKPCVLDLKMGTRQYGIYASKEKRESQMRKCEKSTSKSLGVRVCGMQIYKSIEDRYVYRDKYYGRKLSAKAFRESLIDYLHDGDKLLVHLLPSLIGKLRKLFDIIRSLRGYRFYASSLLLLYDGEPTSPLHGHIDIKIIDFANCVHAAMFDPESGLVGTIYPFPNFPPSSLGPDHGYLRGIATLLQELAELWYLHASPEDQELYHNELLVEKDFPDAY